MLFFCFSLVQFSLPQSEAMRGREESQAAPSCYFWDAGMRLGLAKHKVRHCWCISTAVSSPRPRRAPPKTSRLISPACVFRLPKCEPFLKARWWMVYNFQRLYFAPYLTPGLLKGQDNGSRWSRQMHALSPGVFSTVCTLIRGISGRSTPTPSTIGFICMALQALIR